MVDPRWFARQMKLYEEPWIVSPAKISASKQD